MVLPSQGPDRGVAPIVSTVLLVAVVVVIGATVAVLALGLGESTSANPPKAVLDTVDKADNGTVFVRHQAGETIDREQLRVRGAANVSAPEKITAGETITVEPEGDAEAVVLAWENEQNSAMLATIPVSGNGGTGATPIVLSGADLEGGEDAAFETQCKDGAINEAQLSDPFTVEVDLNESVDKNASLYVSVQDSYDKCGQAPDDTNSGTKEFEFVDGTASFTIESAGSNEGADFTLFCLFGLCDVEQIDGVYVAVDDSNIDAEVAEIRVDV
jgi:flagellin-like protein